MELNLQIIIEYLYKRRVCKSLDPLVILQNGDSFRVHTVAVGCSPWTCLLVWCCLRRIQVWSMQIQIFCMTFLFFNNTNGLNLNSILTVIKCLGSTRFCLIMATLSWFWISIFCFYIYSGHLICIVVLRVCLAQLSCKIAVRIIITVMCY